MGERLMYWNFSGTAICFPSDGNGGQSVLRANGTSTAGATTYTQTTVNDSTPWAPVAAARGDYAVTTGGYWGIVQAVALPLVTVDFWRFPGVRDRQLPADGTACSIFAKNINAGCGVTGVRLAALRLTTAAAGSISITDQKGTALVTIPTVVNVPAAYEWPTEQGERTFSHPIGLLSVGANAGVLEFVCN